MDENKEMKIKLQKYRKSKGITQQNIANKLGVKRQAISMIENGSRDLSASEFLVMIKEYGLSHNEFLDICDLVDNFTYAVPSEVTVQIQIETVNKILSRISETKLEMEQYLQKLERAKC